VSYCPTYRSIAGSCTGKCIYPGKATLLTGLRVSIKLDADGRMFILLSFSSHHESLVSREYQSDWYHAYPLISTSPFPCPVSNLLKHPGQLCSTKCANISQSIQKCPSQALHSYRPLSLARCSSLSSTSLLTPFVSLFCSTSERSISDSGGAENVVKQPTHSFDPFSRARDQLTMAQLRSGKRWW
jgi:hypothetical protein